MNNTDSKAATMLQQYIRPLSIGAITTANNVFLAPLAGVTDRAFRSLCIDKGAGFVYTEMISAKGIHYNNAAGKELAILEEHERECAGVQIFGSEPCYIEEAASFFASEGARLIDINMGCPVRKITSNGDGSALMRSPRLIEEIVAAACRSVRIPITVKMRRGFEQDNETVVECALAAEAGGASAITVHGRFRDQLYSGYADRSAVARVKEAVRIPVIGNGDITDAQSAYDMFSETGCDAVMIGRASLGNPWIFAELLCDAERPSYTELYETIKRHIELVCRYKGEITGVPEMRKHVAWYLKGLRGSARVRADVCKASSAKELDIIITEYFAFLSSSAVI